jgi:hypothetical protein
MWRTSFDFSRYHEADGEPDGVRHHNATGIDLEAEFKVNLGEPRGEESAECALLRTA